MTAESQDYGSQRLEIRRPPVLVSVSQMVGGMALFLLAMAGFYYNYRLGVRSLGFFQKGGTDLYYTLYLYTLVGYGVAVFFCWVNLVKEAGSFFFKGFGELVTPFLPANIPPDFRDYNEVYRCFRDRALSIYKPMDPFVSGIWGPNTMFLPPAARGVVQTIGISLKHRTVNFFLVIFAMAGIVGSSLWLNSSPTPFLKDLPAELIRELASTGVRSSLVAPLVCMVVVQLLLAAVEFVSILLLAPRSGQPNTVPYESTQDYRGFGHPTQLFARLPDLAIPLEWQGFKNRSRCDRNETPTPSVNDVGSFQGTLFVEQQPRPLASKYGLSASLLLLTGWSCRVAGMALFLFFLLPGPLRNFPMETVRYPQAPVFLLFMIFLASMVSGNGKRYLQQGRTLLEAAQFDSHAILLDVVGTLSRADVRVGKSLSDSIESSSVVARSDFTVRFWAAELVSEIGDLKNPDDRRALLGMNLTPEDQGWIAHFRGELDRLGEEGVKAMRVDLKSQEASDIMRSNVGISAMRGSAVSPPQIDDPSATQTPTLRDPGSAAPVAGANPQAGSAEEGTEQHTE